MAAAVSVYPTLEQRPVKNTVVLFDVDDTLTLPRQVRDIVVDIHGLSGLSNLQARYIRKLSY
jgi:hypothetical protein